MRSVFLRGEIRGFVIRGSRCVLSEEQVWWLTSRPASYITLDEPCLPTIKDLLDRILPIDNELAARNILGIIYKLSCR